MHKKPFITLAEIGALGMFTISLGSLIFASKENSKHPKATPKKENSFLDK